MSRFRDGHGECLVGTHETEIVKENLEANSMPHPFFKDLTPNHNKTLIKFEAEAGAQVASVEGIVHTRDGETRRITIPLTSPGQGQGNRAGSIAVQMEDVCQVDMRGVRAGGGGSADEFDGTVTIQKTFCICCDDEDDFDDDFDDRRDCNCHGRRRGERRCDRCGDRSGFDDIVFHSHD